MDFLRIVLASLASIAALLILGKLMGARQVSQLTMYDYVVGITIGSIAADMAVARDDDFLKALTAMITYGIATFLIAVLTNKSIRFRRALTGETLILMQNGKFFKSNLKKARMDAGEFLSQLRALGYFNPSDVHTVILEANGTISVLPMAGKRPVNPSDLNLSPPVEAPLMSVILDGKILPDNLKATGNDEKWLRNQLCSKGFPHVKDVFLATCDKNNLLEAFGKTDFPQTRDMFE